jgi:hypothetical protein
MSDGTSERPDRDRPGDGLPLRLAFYLPQFHQTPENDAWHSTGFTEWTVVAKSRPLFPGHNQPHLPSELGFCDLRLPETRERQVRLARAHGISGFCYYHYWFTGQRMLERPLREVMRSGNPDFPFCLCWANESWYRRWMGASDELLVEQEFNEEDDLEHIRYLIEAFKDDRYIHVKGRPLLSIYRPDSLPDPTRTVELWRQECARAGVPEPWLVGFETWGARNDPASLGCDASAEFVPHGLTELADQLEPPALCDPGNEVYDYVEVARGYAGRPDPAWIRYPCVATGWDNTPRRRDGEAFLLVGSTPERYGEWLAQSMRNQIRTQGSDGVVFINAWNEWAEGAHLEPDTTFGRRYLEVTRDVVRSLGGTVDEHPVHSDRDEVPPPPSIEDLYADLYDTLVQLQSKTSGFIGLADRRLQAERADHARDVAELREQNRKLAEWCLSLEEQIAFVRRQRDELVPPETTENTTSTVGS